MERSRLISLILIVNLSPPRLSQPGRAPALGPWGESMEEEYHSLPWDVALAHLSRDWSLEKPAFYDRFDGPSLDPTKWTIDNRPANGTMTGHKGYFTRDNLDFSTGMLRMKLVQGQSDDGFVSYGASIQSKDKFGYGRYQFVMRMASTSPTPGAGGWRSAAAFPRRISFLTILKPSLISNILVTGPACCS